MQNKNSYYPQVSETFFQTSPASSHFTEYLTKDECNEISSDVYKIKICNGELPVHSSIPKDSNFSRPSIYVEATKEYINFVLKILEKYEDDLDDIDKEREAVYAVEVGIENKVNEILKKNGSELNTLRCTDAIFEGSYCYNHECIQLKTVDFVHGLTNEELDKICEYLKEL